MVASEPTKRALPASLITAVLLVAGLGGLLMAAAPAAAATPTFQLAVVRDLDGNGFADAMDLQFSDPVDDATIRAGDFIISPKFAKIVPFVATTTVETGGGITCAPSTINDPCFRLVFREHVLLPTNFEVGYITPHISYVASTDFSPQGTLRGTGGERVPSFETDGTDVRLRDGAPPALWGASAKAGRNWVIATFSEPIPSLSTVGPDFCLIRSAGTQETPLQAISDGKRRVNITLASPITSADMGNSPAKLVAKGCASAEGAITDSAGNRNPANRARDVMGLAWNTADGYVERVVGHMGSKVLQVMFTSGVEATGGCGNPDQCWLKAEHFSVRTTPGQGFTGIDEARHIAGSPWVELITKEKLTQFDLSASGPELRVNSNSVRAFWDDNVMPTQLVRPKDEGLLGRPTLAPRDAIQAFDLNGNGYIDTLRVNFTEHIFDELAGLGVQPDSPPADGWKAYNGLTPVSIHEIISGGAGTKACTTAAKTSVPAGRDDNLIYLCFKEGKIDEFGECDPAQGACLHSGIRLAVSYQAPGGSGPRIQDRSTAQNRMASFQYHIAIDKAPPRLLMACTKDMDGNGLIDAYALKFSEAMQDSRLLDDHWKVAAPYDDVSAFIDPDGAVDNKVQHLPFEENSDKEESGDTGETPQIRYERPASQDERVRDLNGNEMPPVTDADVKETDCAAPVIMRIEAAVDTDTADDKATVVFSEPVRDFKNSTLGTANFQYHNEVGGGASGFRAAEHSKSASKTGFGPSEHIVVLTLNGDLGDADLRLDRISAGGLLPGGQKDALIYQASHFVRKAAGDPKDPELWVDSSKQLNFKEPTGDRAGPSAPQSITVTDGSKPATRAKLSFPAVTDPSGIARYEIRYHTAALTNTCFTDSAGTLFTFSSGIKTSGAQEIDVGPLNPDTSYYFCIRAVDGAGNAGSVAVVGQAHKTAAGSPETGDNQPPAKVGTVTVTETANSATLDFTAPADDKTGASSLSYRVRVSTTSFTSFDGARNELPTGVTVEGPTTTGSNAKLVLVGLTPDQPYHVAVAGVDAAGLAGAASTPVSFRTKTDTSPPPSAPVVSWAGHQSGVATMDKNPTFTWTAVVDPDSLVEYFWAVSEQQDYTVTGTEQDSTRQTTASPSNLALGTSYFHVAAVSAGGPGPTGTYKLVITGPSTITAAEIASRNEAIQDGVTVTKDGNAVRIAWALPAAVASDAEGVQVWCGDGTTYQEVADISKQDRAVVWQESAFRDMSPCAGGKYLVTAYYASNQGHADTFGGVPGATSLEPTAVAKNDPFMPAWLLWTLLGAGLLILVLVIVMLVLRGRRKGPAQQQAWEEQPPAQQGWAEPEQESWGGGEEDVPYADEPDVPYADEPAPSFQASPGRQAAAAGAGAAAATPNPADTATMHHVTCPECNDTFIAEGRKPLRIECPNCGVQGMLG